MEEKRINGAMGQATMMQQEQSEVNLMDILLLAWRYWYVYVVVLALCVGSAVYYLKKTPPQYQRVATVLIKDKDSKAPSEAQVFKEVSFLNVNANVENELLIFKSQRLAEDVVRRLNLEVSYKKQSGLRQVDLYGVSPVQVVFPEGERLACTLKVGLKSSKEVTLSDFRYQGELLGQEMTARLNDTVQTPVGRLVVKPTEFLTKEVLGEEIDVLKGTLEGVALAYSNAVVASKASKEATMIQLSLTDESPRRAEDVLNTLVTAYKEDMIRDKNTVTQNTERFIAERLQILEQELGGVDSKIAEYKSANQMTDLASQTGLYLANADKYQNEAVTLQNEKMLTQYLKQYVLDPTKDKELIPANTGVNDQNLEQQIAEYNKLRLQLDKLGQGTTGENPVVLDLQQTMRSLRESIIRTLDNNLQALNLRIGSLQRQEARSTQKVASMPTQQKFVLSVERQQKVKEQLYVYLLQKREENALAAYITESNARIVDRAKGTNVPVAPRTMMILLAAVVLGLALPTGGFFLWNMLDTKVKRRKDLEDRISVPFLGDVPMAKKKGSNVWAKPIAIRVSGSDALTESFRMLRTNLMLMLGSEKQVVTMTSLTSASGKSFIVSNLGAALAFTGKKVLLLDLDIRKGSLTRRMGGKGQVGVTHYLTDRNIKPEELIRSTEVEHLDIVYSGILPPNPAELLMSNRLDELMATYRERYDYILIDGVPATMVADATIVDRLTDLTLFVLRAGIVDKRQLPEVERMYGDQRFHGMALVLNGVAEDNLGYGRYGRYGASYGYGYRQQEKA